MNYQPKECEKQFISKDIDIIHMNDMYKIIAKNNIMKGTVILVEIPRFNLFGEKNENHILQMLYILLQNKDNIQIKNLYPRKNIEILNTINNPYIVNIIRLINNCRDNKIKKYLQSYDKNTLYTYYYKYLFNAFSMYSTATILPIGAMMNHSCMPNIKFYEKNEFKVEKNIDGKNLGN